MEPVDITLDEHHIDSGDALPRLRLRSPRAHDREAIRDMYNDPRTAHWSLVQSPFTQQHTMGFLRMCEREWQRDSPRWLVTDNDQVVGTVGLRKHPRQTWEIVYHTAPWARRRKVALRSVHAAATFAFDKLGAQRLRWSGIVGNHLSRLIAIRLGFSMEGTERSSADQRGNRVDQWIASLLPGELRELDNPPAGYDIDRTRALMFCQPPPSLDTALPGLRLRPLRHDDIDLIVDTSRDEETSRWTTVPQPYQREDAEFFVDVVGARKWLQGDQATFALADADDKYCGAIDLRLYFPDKLLGEVGFVTAPWARGKGYMTAALKTVCDFGFDSFGLERIEWKAFVGNDGSLRVAQKAGLTIEGTLRSDIEARGERVDTLLAAMAKRDRT